MRRRGKRNRAYYIEGEHGSGELWMRPISRAEAADLVRRFGEGRVRKSYPGSRTWEIPLCISGHPSLGAGFNEIVVAVMR